MATPRRQRARGPRHIRDDVRVVRRADRKAPQQARRCTATVNFASEQAAVSFDPASDRRRPRRRGRGGRLRGRHCQRRSAGQDDPARPYRARLVVAAVLSVPVALLAWAPPLVSPVGNGPRSGWPPWSWRTAAGLSTGGRANARHGVATMDTLISLGTLAAWGWSVVVSGWWYGRGASTSTPPP